ncbi:TPA: YfhO family protein [bacterium]|nr:YfhO family protein [bacterium]
MESLKNYWRKFIEKLSFFSNKFIEFFLKHEYLKVFTFLFLLGLVMFSSRTVTNYFTLPMNGDYILQQLPFHENGYDNIWHFLRTGEFVMWSYENFIGVNYFAANTFYYLTSPFFIPILFVPRFLIPQMIYIMMVVKLATGGLLFYILLKKFYKVSKEVSFIGATVYAFCGWGMYYLWFNHFADVLALFPLTLIGVEYCLTKRKGWVLTLGMFLMGMTNYFFLFTFAITTPLYALFRVVALNKGKGFKGAKEGFFALAQTALYFIAGILLTGFILLPAYRVVGDTPRVANSNYYVERLLEFFFTTVDKKGASYDFGPLKELDQIFSRENFMGLFDHLFVFSGGTYQQNRFYYPISTFLYLNVSDYNSLLFNTNFYDNAASSLFISTPLALLLWCALFDSIKNKKYWNLFGFIVVIIMLFTPITYVALHGFTTVTYARWQIFVVALSLIFILTYFDKINRMPKYLDLAVIINLGLAIWVFAIAFGSNMIDTRYRIYFIIGQIIYILVAYIYLRHFYKYKEIETTDNDDITLIDRLFFNSKRTYSMFYFIIVVELLVCSTSTLFMHGVKNYSELYGGQDNLRELHEIVNYIKANDDDDFYRIFNTEADRGYNNLQMNLNYNGLSTFHSVYNYQSQDLIDASDIAYQGNWSMGVHEKRYNLETFLNVKYYIVKKGDNNIPLGYSLMKEFPNHSVYVNDNHIELGYAFDTIANYNSIKRSTVSMTYKSLDVYEVESNYYNFALLYDEDFKEVSELLGEDISVEDKITSTYSKANGDIYFLPRKYIKEGASQAERDLIENQSEAERERLAINPNNKLSSTYFNSELKQKLGKLDDIYHKENKLLGPWKNASINRNWDGDKIIYIPQTPICENASLTEEGCNVLVNFHLGPNADVKLYGGENKDKLLVSDYHMIHHFNKDNDIKYYRGFYVKEPVTRVVIEFLNDHTFNSRLKAPVIYYEYYSDYLSRINKLKENEFSNISYTKNTISFTTNYEDKKFIVLSVPYNEGWSISVKDKNGNKVEAPKIYNADGGLIGFIASEGELHYHLNYVSPGMKEGISVSLLGLVVVIVLSLFYNRKSIIEFIKSRVK